MTKCFSFLIIGPHDGIGGTVKRKVYQEVTSGRIVIEDAQQFANEADRLCKIRGKLTHIFLNLIGFLSIGYSV